MVAEVALDDAAFADRDLADQAAERPKMTPPSIWAAALSVLTTSPQSTAA